MLIGFFILNAALLCQYLTFTQKIVDETAIELHSDDPKYLQTLFNSYSKKFKKKYKSTQNQQKKFETFKIQAKRITEHNKAYLNGTQSFFKKLGPNADKTQEEFINWLKKGFKSIKNRSFRNITRFKRTVLPNSVDLRAYLPPVKNQQECGSCWTFASTVTMEYQYNKAKKESKKIISFSEQQLLDCAVEEGENGCDGGLPEEALSLYLTENGIEQEKDYAYGTYPDEQSAKSGICKYNRSLAYATVKKVYKTIGNDELSLKQALVNSGVVAIGVDATEFLNYGGGIFTGDGCSSKLNDANHAVALVGYGYTNGKGYYILRNSWGQNWGERGYMRIQMGKNICGVANDVVFPIINLLK